MALAGGDFGSVQPQSGGLEIGRDIGGRAGSGGVEKRFDEATA